MKSIHCLLVTFFWIVLINATSIAQTPEIWGTSHKGGKHSAGSIFKLDSNGNQFNIVHSFEQIDGNWPWHTTLCKAKNDKLYGLTHEGGLVGFGVLFEYDPATNNYSKKFDFTESDGKSPRGSLIAATNGKLYGMARSGGVHNMGVLFEYDPTTDKFTKKIDFKDTTLGSYPHGSLLEATNGKLYGMTSEGGIHQHGVLFEYDISNDTLIKKVDLQSPIAATPQGSLIQASNGKLYGMSIDLDSLGTLFEYNISSNTIVKRVDFDGVKFGKMPFGDLTEAPNGKLYGMTSSGGANNEGVLFEFNPSNNMYANLMDFDEANTGKHPYGSLTLASNGKLYGLTSSGGNGGTSLSGDGTLFEYDPVTNAYFKKVEFDSPLTGKMPLGSLFEHINGKLYGMNFYTGFYLGNIFEYDIATNNIEEKIEFGKNEGRFPIGKLLHASNGKFYGITRSEGEWDNSGLLYEFDPILSKYTRLKGGHSFLPLPEITQGQNGKLYGIAQKEYKKYVIYEYDLSNHNYIEKIELNWEYGEHAPLLAAQNGKLYGIGAIYRTTYPFKIETLFEYDYTINTITHKHRFQNYDEGKVPFSGFIESNDGKIYGTAHGGPDWKGVLYEYNLSTEAYQKIYDFNDTIRLGNYLVLSSTNKLYAINEIGGTKKMGVLSEYDLKKGSGSNVLEFNQASRYRPSGSIVIGPNGKIYGVKGSEKRGVLYEFDPANKAYTIKVEFDTTLIANFSRFNHLIVRSKCPPGLNNAYQFGSLLTASVSGAEYQWLDCNNSYMPVMGENDRVFSATQIGSYAVAISLNGCVDTSSCFNVTSIGIEDTNEHHSVSIFPNPTAGIINIDLGNNTSAYQVNVSTLHGQLIYKKQLNNQSYHRLNTKLQKGVYIIQVMHAKGVHSEKITIQ